MEELIIQKLFIAWRVGRKSMNQKKEKLSILAKKRQKDCYPGFKNLCDYHDGYYECDYVSPYSISANNVDANIMIILQDWASDEVLKEQKNDTRMLYGYDPDRPTNINLKSLLKNHFKMYLEDTYTTNLFPFIKMGGQSGSIKPRKYLIKAAKEYAIEQIRIVKPCLVIALGVPTFNALAKICNKHYKWETGKNLIGQHFICPGTGSHIWFQYHTSRYTGGKDKVNKNWDEMKKGFIS